MSLLFNIATAVKQHNIRYCVYGSYRMSHIWHGMGRGNIRPQCSLWFGSQVRFIWSLPAVAMYIAGMREVAGEVCRGPGLAMYPLHICRAATLSFQVGSLLCAMRVRPCNDWMEQQPDSLASTQIFDAGIDHCASVSLPCSCLSFCASIRSLHTHIYTDG